MIKLPTETKRHSISSGSDLFGTIHRAKNINLDEPGYIKLAPRVVSIFNQVDTPSLRLPVAFGRNVQFTSPEDSIDFAITQAGQKGYWLTLLLTSVTLTSTATQARRPSPSTLTRAGTRTSGTSQKTTTFQQSGRHGRLGLHRQRKPHGW